MYNTIFYKGPLDRAEANLKYTPPFVRTNNYDFYERIDDPDTGEYLGLYVYRKDIHE